MLFLSLIVFLVAVVLTGVIRFYAVSRNVMDIPNQRSSHTAPTPRGGGLAIVLAFFFASIFLFLNQLLLLSHFLALSSCLLVAFIGFCDDHAHIAARWRFLIHLLTALSVLFFLHGFPTLLLPGLGLVNLDWFGWILATILLVWFLNLFNFMDGTDGIAASEALFVSSALAGFLFFIDISLFKVTICLAAASLGFLLWNWPKASIFMGDVGSGFLGLLLGVIVLMAAQLSPALLYSGLILFGIFMVDATYTLLIRFGSGQKWHEAHCSHTYQKAAKRFGHLPVLLACWSINLCWLLPISAWVFFYPTFGLLGLLLAYLPLIWLANYFNAGHAQIESL